MIKNYKKYNVVLLATSLPISIFCFAPSWLSRSCRHGKNALPVLFEYFPGNKELLCSRSSNFALNTMNSTQLFGGALTCQLPTQQQWIDVSTIRQVPNHQECFLDQEHRLFVIEILDLQTSVSDDTAASYFFDDLAEANGIPTSDRTRVSAFKTETPAIGIPNLPPGTSICSGVGFQHVAQGRDYDVFGNPREQEKRWIRVELCVIRLRAVSTDLLLTLSTPNEQNPQDPGPPSELFRSIASSLVIHDWSLFAG